MGNPPKIKKHQQESFIKKTLSEKKSVSDLTDDGLFKLSLQHFDREQGQTFSNWEESLMLSHAMETIRNYSHSAIEKQLSDVFTVYGSFPPKEKTEFRHPEQVPEDAKWARIHINGTHCLIGHVVKNTFYLVFLDKDHKFWKSKLKNT